MEKFINGECGEQITVYPTRVKKEGEVEHEAVFIELEGLSMDSNGDLNIILSPFTAKILSEAIKNSADEAYEVNYHLLVDKT